ncbi:MAG: imelysin family protein [Rhizobiaceae bacterium]
MFKALFLTAALLAPATLHAENAPPRPGAAKVVSRAVEKFVRPGYARFHGDVVMLKTAMDDLCTTPGPTAFAEVREDFAAAVASWSAISIIRIGPIAEKNRLARILSWPDPDGAAMAEVKAAIAGGDKALTDAKSLATRSPALQGLTALQYVLYGEGAKDLRGSGGSFRCHYGAAIAQNVQTIAENVQQEWDDPKGFRAVWVSPGPQNPIYRDQREMLASLVAQFSDALRPAHVTRPAEAVADTDKTDALADFPFSLSHNTFQSLAAELDGMRLLFESSRIGSLLKPNDKWIADSISFEFRNAHDTLAAIINSHEKPLSAADRAKAAEQINGIIGRLSGLFTVKLARALDVAGGTAAFERG